MSDADPLACLPLEPGERVLWQGRPRVGAPRSGRGLALDVLLFLALAGMLLAGPVSPLRPTPLGGALALAAGVIGVLLVATCVDLASAFVGPYHLSLASLGLSALLFGRGWANVVLLHGFDAALRSFDAAVVLLTLAFAGVPAAWILWNVLERLAEVVVITDRRVATVLATARRATVVWERPLVNGLLDLRLVRSWRRGTHLAVGMRALHLRGVDPERLLADLRAAAAP